MAIFTSGGLLGGVFTAVVAPRVFSEFYELPLAFAAAFCHLKEMR